MIIVSDTSPISNLLKINQIFLLKEIYQSVVIPEAVFQELKTSRDFDITQILTPNWAEVRQISNNTLYQSLLEELDPGEAEAIVLASELNADVLLMDERRGRQTAISLGLKVTGVAGVLLTAKGVGLIPEVKPLLDDLESKAGFWMGAAFRNYVLELANELPTGK